jgi:hypothetical protein
MSENIDICKSSFFLRFVFKTTAVTADVQNGLKSMPLLGDTEDTKITKGTGIGIGRSFAKVTNPIKKRTQMPFHHCSCDLKLTGTAFTLGGRSCWSQTG